MDYKSTKIAVLIWAFWDFRPKIYTIDSSLSLPQYSIFEQESTPRYPFTALSFLDLDVAFYLPVLNNFCYSTWKTIAVAPFVVNYSGALFRQYPGEEQSILDVQLFGAVSL